MMRKAVIILLVFFPFSLKCQDIINIPGNRYVSLSADVLSNTKTFDLGLSKYRSGKSVIGVTARYQTGITTNTRNQYGYLCFRYAYRGIRFSDRFLIFFYGGGNLGGEYLTSEVEDGKYTKTFPVYGLSVGGYSELYLMKGLTFTISADFNTRWKSKVSEGYSTLRFGFNYYL